ncbi:DUF3320 domain-containing protein [Eilatimonas milleporae]|uniref:DUF3320 domain-containing protein n=1 Tax=Eilatimonas milleporae TaxID=911205 RepID=UPI000EF9B758|nr:DUF3320 domain-containing protein [Eilatimonas milleporae]
MGLNALVLITRNHAFTGCWLVDEDFSSAVQDDPQAIRKRVQLGEMVLIETTLVTKRPAPSLKTSAKAALAHLEQEEAFHLAVDIRRARMGNIRPVMLEDTSDSTPQTNVEDDLTPTVPPFEEAPDLPDIEVISTREEKPTTPEGRIDLWKRRLLDMTLRNNLLNFKAGKKSVPLYCTDPSKLEDLMASGQSIKFVAMPTVMNEHDPRSARLHHERFSSDAKEAPAREYLNRGEILVALPENDVRLRLTELYRKARNDLEEGGTNTLFLALGSLKWKETETSERTLHAPLLLLPVALERKSIASGYRLSLMDDDPQINPTLLQKLKTDFELYFPEFEDELPTDHAGLDVSRIWQIVRNKIRDIKGWELTENVIIATFSFTKYLMWRDLEDRTEQLKESAVVKHLIDTPREAFTPQGAFVESRDIDDYLAPKDTYCPILADASQLAAVVAAASGKNFVLIGPPGTGKSQTITNIIVQCLAEGKTVLFVSEKMAALDVVYRRLRDVGMGDFCLELHSSKARKLDILAQLKNAWDTASQHGPEEWEREAARLEGMRQQMNALPRALHRRHDNGLTVFDAISFKVAYEDTPKVDLAVLAERCLSENALDNLRECVKRLSIAAETIGDPGDHPFGAIAKTEWSNAWQESFEAKTRDLLTALENLKPRFEALRSTLSLNFVRDNTVTLEALDNIGELLTSAYGKPYAFAAEIASDLRKAAENGRTFLKVETGLKTHYERNVLNADLEDWLERWMDAQATWWPRNLIVGGKVRKEIASHIKSRTKPASETLLTDLETLKDLRSHNIEIEKLAASGQVLGRIWRGADTDWSEVDAAVSFADSLRLAFTRLAGDDIDHLMGLRTDTKRLLNEGNDLLSAESTVGSKVITYRASLKKFNIALSALQTHIKADILTVDTFQGLDTQLNQWLTRLPRLKEWCAWQHEKAKALHAGLRPVVEKLEDKTITARDIPHIFEVSYRCAWGNRAIDNDDTLRTFASAQHERLIEEFRSLDQKLMKLTSAQVRARLAGKTPSRNSMSNSRQTEWGLLNREINKKRRHMPLRKLIGELPSALTKLTPCLLMSPLSISQYLSTEAKLFDLVVFDEASQIPTWDAIGALARGRQAIVVGDPKQLPPTNFFGRNDDEAINEDLQVEDLESILDECTGANLPVRYLDRHYRSRHESLIAFSNHRYYGSKLVTFPSPVTSDVAVTYHHVPKGIYEQGTRINRTEAQKVAEAVVIWLKKPQFTRAKDPWSIGVVTFNSQQQTLIQDLLDQACAKDPDIDHHFSTDRIEPVFVKNIENVQGDERDVILFSLTYGPRATGRISMNFGPMNKEGGERRLNVAITRARHMLHVYGTLKAEDIDLNRSKTKGVRDFKHFLEFAEKGPRALESAADASGGEYESPFEKAVAERLAAKGWDVIPQIGVSSYRIDLGIIHPDTPGRYLAGVECDGATYHSSASARERDRLREMVLNGLGWKIVRVWSTDWWVNPADSLEKIHAKLEALLDTDRREKECHTATTVEEDDTNQQHHASVANQREQTPMVSNDSTFSTEENLPENIFVETDLNALGLDLKPDDFFEPSEKAKIARMITLILENEAPIAIEMVATRIARMYGFARTGAKIARYIQMTASRLGNILREQDGLEVLWRHDQDPNGYTAFRIVNPSSREPRKAEFIPMIELLNLVHAVKDEDLPFDTDALRRGMGRRLGYNRITKKIAQRLDAAIENAIRD